MQIIFYHDQLPFFAPFFLVVVVVGGGEDFQLKAQGGGVVEYNIK